jgi:hypothetical protein
MDVNEKDYFDGCKYISCGTCQHSDPVYSSYSGKRQTSCEHVMGSSHCLMTSGNDGHLEQYNLTKAYVHFDYKNWIPRDPGLPEELFDI